MKRKPRENPIYSRDSSEKKLYRTYSRMFFISFIVLIGIMAYGAMFRQNVAIIEVTEDDQLVFSPEDGEVVAVAIEDIVTIEKLEKAELGECIESYEGSGYTYGIWEHEQIGQYLLFDYDSASTHIRIEIEEQGCIVFNYMNTNNTNGMYEGLVALMDMEGNE